MSPVELGLMRYDASGSGYSRGWEDEERQMRGYIRTIRVPRPGIQIEVSGPGFDSVDVSPRQSENEAILEVRNRKLAAATIEQFIESLDE